MDTTLQEMLLQARAKQNERLALDRQSKLLKVEEDQLFALVMMEMQEMGLRHLEVDGLRADIVEKDKPYISDFAALEGYIREHGALDLLQRRLTESAVKLRWEDGVQIPGVGVMTEQKLTIK